jgi:hypothetical protein
MKWDAIPIDAENWRITRNQGHHARWLLQMRISESEWETVRVFLEYLDAQKELRHILRTGNLTEL